MLVGDMPFIVSEWEWFKLKLEMFALQERTLENSIGFRFDDEARKVTCLVWYKQTEDLIEERASKAVQWAWYENWAGFLKREIKNRLQPIPHLSDDFNLETNLAIEILRNYGMGASLICTIVGDSVLWNEAMVQA